MPLATEARKPAFVGFICHGERSVACFMQIILLHSIHSWPPPLEKREKSFLRLELGRRTISLSLSLSLSPSLYFFSISSREKIERGAMEEEDSSHSSTIEEELHDSEPLAATSRIRDQNTGDVVDAAEDDDERNGDRAELPDDSESDWTDEKHSMYLQSMEDEFVRSLYAMKRPQQAEAQVVAEESGNASGDKAAVEPMDTGGDEVVDQVM
ncbi:uncharacterized protein LOC9659403 isoform X2 [Selaginella moellendorffii]|uniref:uncharacterized protein LOC9659403 isoform X2 n=1 Tax=Selaginella moellendorffii TaxID=88036 RepID=UPI000D1C42B4|nr:uncharacterized protein LOC9659403 isoform X2 [Selaginella moellendorffii]|eukprot:XP_024525371.1 uncharacterized protein LOC9659403 isoform X2 [Selaginella moellendorffii]